MRPEKMKLNVQALTSFRIKCLVACALYVAMTASGAAAITAGIDEKIVLPFVLLLSLALPIAMLSLVSFKGRNASVPFDGKAPKGRGTLGLLLTASLAFIVGIVSAFATTAATGAPLRAPQSISLASLYWPGQPSERDEAAAVLLLAQANRNKKEEKWLKAIASYRAYLRRVPEDSSAIFDLGTCYKQLGDLEKALQAYSRAFSLEKSKTENLNSLVYKLYYAQESVSGKLRADNGIVGSYSEVGG